MYHHVPFAVAQVHDTVRSSSGTWHAMVRINKKTPYMTGACLFCFFFQAFSEKVMQSACSPCHPTLTLSASQSIMLLKRQFGTLHAPTLLDMLSLPALLLDLIKVSHSWCGPPTLMPSAWQV